MAFDADQDNDTLPPGVVSQEAHARMLEVTGTEPTGTVEAKRGALVKHALSEDGKPKSKWTATEIKRMATDEQWDYARNHGHLDVGTVCAVGNLLLKGLSPKGVRSALGITQNTWNTWYDNGIGEDVGTRPAMTSDECTTAAQPQAPYDVFVFVVDHSQAQIELRAINGWLGHIDRDWRAAQALLVARNPDDYNPTSKTTIDTTIKGDVTVSRHADSDDLLAIANILNRAGALPSTTASAEVIEVESVEVPNEGTEISDR
jgi:hypothetical protein